jgi:hypothetical protein
MQKDKRRAPRRPLRFSAWVALDGNKLVSCALADISDNGAHLEVEDTKVLPDRYCLMPSGRGAVHRECRVIWRKTTQVGVIFEKPLVEGAAPAAKAAAPKTKEAEKKDAVSRGRGEIGRKRLTARQLPLANMRPAARPAQIRWIHNDRD